jgi:hypothetical protein
MPDTFAPEIVELRASRVLARSPFGKDHDAAGVAVATAATPLTRPHRVAVVAGAVVPPPQAPTSEPLPISRTALSVAGHLILIFIQISSSDVLEPVEQAA